MQDFARDGIRFPLRVMDAARAAEVSARWQEFAGREGGAFAARYNKKPHLLLPYLDAPYLDTIVRDPAVVGPVVEALGPDVLCWSSGFFSKPANSGAFVNWHQDSTYWGLSSPDVVTAWVAFTPSTRASGCMRVIPGSHTTDQLPHRVSGDPASMLSRTQEVEVEVDEAQAVDVELQPGEMSLHHVRLIHGSAPNRAPHPRIGFAIRYIAGHVRQLRPGRDSAALVAGRDHGHFELEPSPASDMHPAALACHAGMEAAQAELLNAR